MFASVIVAVLAGVENSGQSSESGVGDLGEHGGLPAGLVPQDLFSSGFRPFQPYENQAAALRLFEHSLVPGLLQTEAYARAVLETHPNTPADVVEERVAARLARQQVLDRDEPPRRCCGCCSMSTC